jgi:hypothetical protein
MVESMKEALKIAGKSDIENDVLIAISKYLNLGGTCARLQELVVMAIDRHPKPKPGGGLSRPVQQDQEKRQQDQERAAPTRPPVPGGSHDIPATHGSQPGTVSVGEPVAGEASQNVPRRGQDQAAPSRDPITSGGGLPKTAKQGQCMTAPAACEPSPSYVIAAGESRRQAARSILYRYKTSTGKWWGDVHPYEVGGMQRDSIRGMALFSACGPLNPKQMRMTFGQLLNHEQSEIAMKKADKEYINVA